MQFDDGSSDVHPGEDITITAQGQTEDLGAATYDSGHDGVADSVIVGDGDHVLVFTDTDHDGHADSVTEYDSSGHVVHGDGSDSTGTSSGNSDDGGASGTSGTTDHDGGGTTGPSGTDTGTDGAPAATITVTADDGSHVGVGAPTVDLNQDGHPDTALVKHTDGSVTGYTDRDGDGQADQITQIASDGSVIITVHDGSGDWHVAATGHVDSSGKLIEDASPTTTSTDSVPNTVHASDVSTEAVPDGTGGAANATTPGSGDITFSAEGKDYDLGKPTADMNGDGTPDTVVSHQADGTVVGYTDTDGDGTADQVTEISPDGHVTIGASDGHGGWHQVATGRLDADGKFVADSGSATTTAQPAAVGS